MQLGLKPRTPGKPQTPQVPKGVTVTGNSLGINTITWKRNGNLPGTSFEVWQANDPMLGWEFVAATNRVSLASKGNKPGIKTYYQVRARRDLRERRHKLPPLNQSRITRQNPGVENTRQ